VAKPEVQIIDPAAAFDLLDLVGVMNLLTDRSSVRSMSSTKRRSNPDWRDGILAEAQTVF
jgi:hypothetical protein